MQKLSDSDSAGQAFRASLPERFDAITIKKDALIHYEGIPSLLPYDAITGLHYHDITEIGVCRSGYGICVFGGEAVAVSAGDVMVVPPGTPHYSRSLSDEGCRCDFVFFDADRLTDSCGIHMPGVLPADRFEIPYVLRSGSPEVPLLKIRDLLIALIDAVIAEKVTSERQAAAYYSLFLLHLPELPPIGDERREYFRKSRNSRLYPALKHIREAYASDLTLAELAADCYMSVSLFSKLFVGEYGMSPISYLNRFRVKAGEQLLSHTGKGVTEISAIIGFNSPSDFYRHFVAEYGISPSRYRKSSASKNISIQNPS